jgi:hypothetical protein
LLRGAGRYAFPRGGRGELDKVHGGGKLVGDDIGQPL